MRWKFESDDFLLKSDFLGSNGPPNQQIRVVDAPRPQNTLELICRDGSSSLRSNIPSAMDMSSDNLGLTYVYFFGRTELFQFYIVGYMFLTPTHVIV